MKTYAQLILELTAYQKLEKDSWAKAATRKINLYQYDDPNIIRKPTLGEFLI